MPYNYVNPNGMINQLYRQKDNIENMLAQCLNQQQAPVQNIINTSNSSDTDIRYVNQNEDITNIIVSKRTLFIDENKLKISMKEPDGTISKTYDIVMPKDEKDLKIEALEQRLKELEGKLDAKSTEPVVSSSDVKPTTTSVTKPTKSTTVTTF